MEVDEELTPVSEPYRRTRQPSSLFQLEFKKRIQGLLDSPNFDIRLLRSRRNSPALASSGNSVSETSDISGDKVPKTSERRKISETSTSSRRLLPQFLSGAAVPNSIVRSFQSIDESSSDEKPIQKRGTSDGSILDRIFRRLLPVTEEKIDDEELLLRIQKELEKRKLLTKTAKKTVPPKEEVVKKIDPEKEKRRHEQRITGVKLVQLNHSRNFETIRRSIELSKPQDETIITDEELLKQQNSKSSSEPIPPTRISSPVKIKLIQSVQVPTIIEEHQENDIQTNIEDTSTKKKDAKAQPDSTAVINLASEQDLIETMSEKSLVSLKEPEINLNEVSWQDMIRDLSELGPIKKMSLLDLEAINQSLSKVNNNESTGDQSDTENKLKRSRKRSRSNSSQKQKSDEKSIGKQTEIQETNNINKEDRNENSEKTENLTKALSDNTELSNAKEDAAEIEPEITLARAHRRSKSNRRSSDSSTSRKIKLGTPRKSIDSSNEKKLKIGTTQKLAGSSVRKKSDASQVSRTSTNLEEKFRSKEIPLQSEMVINRDEIDINKTETKIDASKNTKKSKKQKLVNEIAEVTPLESKQLDTISEKTDIANNDITEKSLLHEIGLLEYKRKKYAKATDGEIKVKLQAEVEAITEKTNILLARRRQSRSQNEVVKSQKTSADNSKTAMKIRSIDVQTKTYSRQLNKPKQESLTKQRRISVTT